MYVLTEPQSVSFEKAGHTGKIFPSDGLSSKAGYVLLETGSGNEATLIEHESDFIYYILEGEGFFEVEGSREVCKAGNLVVIPAGHKFTYKGSLKMLLINTPAWREEQEETL